MSVPASPTSTSKGPASSSPNRATTGASRAGSIIRVEGNIYSVASRLIGEKVEVRVHAEHVEVWYAQKLRERMPRLRGRGKHALPHQFGYREPIIASSGCYQTPEAW